MAKSWTISVSLILGVVAMSAVALAEVEEAGPPSKIFLKKTEPRSVATMRHKGSFEEIPAVIMKLIFEVNAGGYHMTGPLTGIYYNDPQEVPEEELVWEVWAPVAYPGPVRPVENDEMSFKYLDPMFVAYTYHIGPYESIDEAYDSLMEWAERNKYKIIGPPIELYWSDPASVPAEKLVTEIWFPVEEKKTPGMVR